jgi:hypothetical protein
VRAAQQAAGITERTTDAPLHAAYLSAGRRASAEGRGGDAAAGNDEPGKPATGCSGTRACCIRLRRERASVLSAARLQRLLGLTDDELLEVLGSDPISVITGEEDLRPELAILEALLREPEETLGVPTLQRWVRTSGPRGRPLDLLLRQDFAGFEDALAELAERGFVIRRPDPGASRRARPR